MVQRYSLPWQEVLKAGAWGGWSHCSHSQEAESDECLFSTHLLPFIQAKYRVGCPNLHNPSQAAQGLVSLVIPDHLNHPNLHNPL